MRTQPGADAPNLNTFLELCRASVSLWAPAVLQPSHRRHCPAPAHQCRFAAEPFPKSSGEGEVLGLTCTAGCLPSLLLGELSPVACCSRNWRATWRACKRDTRGGRWEGALCLRPSSSSSSSSLWACSPSSCGSSHCGSLWLERHKGGQHKMLSCTNSASRRKALALLCQTPPQHPAPSHGYVHPASLHPAHSQRLPCHVPKDTGCHLTACPTASHCCPGWGCGKCRRTPALAASRQEVARQQKEQALRIHTTYWATA